MVVNDLAEPLEHFADVLAVGDRVLGHIALGQLNQVGLWREDRRHIFNPRDVFADGRVGDFKLLGQRMESDADANRLVVLGEDLTPEQTSHEGGDSLLAVDEDAFPGGGGAILELYGGVAPRDEVADGVTLVK